MKKVILTIALYLTTCIVVAQKNVVKFKATISNPNSDSIYFRKKDGKIIKAIALVNDSFNTKLSVKQGLYEVFDGKEYTEVYLKNGYNLTMMVDAKNFDNTIQYEGIGSKENNFLANRYIGENEYSTDKLMNASEREFEKLILLKKEYDQKKLNKAKLEPELEAILIKNQKMELQELTNSYKQQRAIMSLQNAPLPGFDFTNYKGGKTNLENLKGKYLLIDIWATWCGPCIQEIPFLKKMEEKYRGKQIEFVSISVDDEKDIEKWKKMVASKDLNGVQLHANNDWNSDFIKALQLHNIPRFILVNPKGIIINSNSERPSDPKLTETLDKLLN
jgi:thiol-disulfide isomerase/thioredoxin